jgi:DNA-binding MarR family transcriptional regulator
MPATPQTATLLFLREEELRQGLELLFFAGRDLDAEADSAMAQLGLGPMHRRILHFAAREPQIAAGTLLTTLRLSKQTLSRLVHDLIEKGLLSQKPGNADRRQRLLSLTVAGATLERTLWERQRQRIARAWRAAGPESVEGFRRVLLGLIEQPRDRQRFERDGTAGEL